MRVALESQLGRKVAVVFELHCKNNWARCTELACVEDGDSWRPACYHPADTYFGRPADYSMRQTPLEEHDVPNMKHVREFWQDFYSTPDVTVLINQSVNTCVCCGINGPGEIITEEGIGWAECTCRMRLWQSDEQWRAETRLIDLTPLFERGHPSPVMLNLCSNCREDASPRRGGLRWRDIVWQAGAVERRRRALWQPAVKGLGVLTERYQKTWPSMNKSDSKKRAVSRHVRRLVAKRQWPAIKPATRMFFQLIIGAKTLEKLTSKIPA